MMRFPLKTVAVAAAATAVALSLPAAHAAAPVAPTVVSPAPVRLDDDNAKRIAEIPNLRAARAKLSEVAKMLRNDVVDPKGFRHESCDLIDKAVVDLTNEINEYKGDEPVKK